MNIRRWAGALIALASMPLHAQVTFPVSFDLTANVLTPTEKANITSHLQAAGRRWAQTIGQTGVRSIEIQVSVSNVPTANATSATTVFVANVGGRALYEQAVAHELRTGTDPNGITPDALVTFGLDYLRNELWFDPDPDSRTAPVPANRTDAMSVALHEFGHALVYNGWADLTTGQPPATYWSTFDRWMQPGAPTVFTGANAVLSWGSAPDVTTGNNKHWGNAAAMAGLPPVPARVLPSVEWVDGAPTPLPACGHLAAVEAPPSADGTGTRAGVTLIDELMNGVVFYRGTRYDISPLDRATLVDTGVMPDRVFANGFDP